MYPSNPPPVAHFRPTERGTTAAPTPLSNVGGVLRTVRLVVALVFGLPCLVGIVYLVISSALSERKNVLVFDNGTTTEVAILIDGKPVGQALSGEPTRQRESTPAIEVGDGDHLVRIEHDGKPIEEARFTVPKRSGLFGHGMRAIYSIGGKTRYAQASAVYVAPGAHVTQESAATDLVASGPIVMVPREMDRVYIERIDMPFSKNESIPESKTHVVVTHICRVTGRSAGDRVIGCPGFD